MATPRSGLFELTRPCQDFELLLATSLGGRTLPAEAGGGVGDGLVDAADMGGVINNCFPLWVPKEERSIKSQ